MLWFVFGLLSCVECSGLPNDITVIYPLGGQIPVEFSSSADPSVVVNDRISLESDSSPQHNRYLTAHYRAAYDPRYSHQGIAASDYIDADTMVIGSSFRASVDVRVPLSHSVARSFIMPIGSGSRFLEQVGHFLITPHSHNESMLVINPSNIFDYAYERSFMFAEIIENGPGLRFNSSIKLLRGEHFEVIPLDSQTEVGSAIVHETTLRFDGGKTFYLPREIVNAFVGECERLGLIDPDNNYPLLIIPDGERQTIMNLLPIIIVEIGNVFNPDVLAIGPDDYLQKRSALYSYESRIASRRNDETIELGQGLVNKLTIYIDGTNGRIGFADPILEMM